ncbi:ATP-binding protein [Rhodococcus sp. USK13]|uniref:ATP-binding protein n=1 Tax=Rhodococcus sp. USK13 TaxID=2806442 RepID=UPI001BCF123D|nr:ATP-binding protein [Rhodococcus sp. USK13]
MTGASSVLPLAVEPCWHMHSIQITNWGGFDGGGHIMLFDRGKTLVSGAPGTGKSTMLDAYLAVMMPGSRLRFNEASNDTGGRARDANTGQRTLIDYLRGKSGEYRERGSAETRSTMLRGDNASTWGAIAANFVNDKGAQFSAIRLYFVPRDATSDNGITKIGLTSTEHIDIDRLGDFVNRTGFTKDEIRAHFPVEWFRKPTEFEARVQTHLGIGAGGNGADALLLLSRIQAGKAMDYSVDNMFKELVLDEPATFTQAANAVKAFTSTEVAYQAAIEAENKRVKLQPIEEHHATRELIGGEIYLLEALGTTRPETDPTPFATWARAKERRLLDAAINANSTTRDKFENDRVAAKRRIDSLDIELARIAARIADAGGGIEALNSALLNQKEKLRIALEDREAFDTAIAVLQQQLPTETDFTEAQTQATQFLASHPQTRANLKQQHNDAMPTVFKTREHIRELEEERTLLLRNKGRMAPSLLQSRQTIIDATGLTADDLPFVGELIDINAAQHRWRTAAEVTLGAIARVMLVDDERLEELSATIDSLPMRRINYHGVSLHTPPLHQPQPDHISGVLDFADDSPFIGWVRDRVCGTDDDAIRVESPAQLNGSELRVTPSGQIRRGRRGAAGTADIHQVIGFSNKTRIAEIDTEIAGNTTILEKARRHCDTLEQQIAHLDKLKAAYTAVANARWARIDVTSAQADVNKTEQAITDLENATPVLRELRIEQKKVSSQRDADNNKLGVLAHRITELTNTFDSLTAREDQVRQAQSYDTTVTNDQHTTLDARYDELDADKPYTPDEFRRTTSFIRREVGQQIDKKRKEHAAVTDKLTAIFSSYTELHGADPNRGIGIDSYGQYLAILQQITADEVFRLREAWQLSMDDQTVTNLIQLKQAYDEAHERIEERLHPIRRILAKLPFGEKRHRIAIDKETLFFDDVAEFRARIDELTSELAAERSDEEYTARYEQMKALIDQISKPEHGTAGAAKRRRLLDVNDHINITAVEYDLNDTEVKRYDLLGPLSGGERREFVAFVAAAALRFRLGDSSNTYPRYAPVILDEAFIKANGEFARRGVDAWTELGFQLIIAAPQDKVTGVEKAMDHMKCVVKNTAGRSYISEYRKQ